MKECPTSLVPQFITLTHCGVHLILFIMESGLTVLSYNSFTKESSFLIACMKTNILIY